jgi:hypothetical protein
MILSPLTPRHMGIMQNVKVNIAVFAKEKPPMQLPVPQKYLQVERDCDQSPALIQVHPRLCRCRG